MSTVGKYSSHRKESYSEKATVSFERKFHRSAIQWNLTSLLRQRPRVPLSTLSVDLSPPHRFILNGERRGGSPKLYTIYTYTIYYIPSYRVAEFYCHQHQIHSQTRHMERSDQGLPSPSRVIPSNLQSTVSPSCCRAQHSHRYSPSNVTISKPCGNTHSL